MHRAGVSTTPAVGSSTADSCLPGRDWRQVCISVCLVHFLVEVTVNPFVRSRCRLPSCSSIFYNRLHGMTISRAAVPPGFAVDSVRSSMPAYASLDWGILRSLSAQRFPGFGKPFAPSDRSSTTNPSTQVRDSMCSVCCSSAVSVINSVLLVAL